MNKFLTKLLAGAAFAAVTGAVATQAVADPGRCSVANTSDWDCVEWTDSNGDWNHTTQEDWFGPNGNDDFVFSGDTVLTCGTAVVDCTLTLEGQARINTENGDDFGIRVRDGSVSGGLLCGAVSLGFDPNWYVDDNNHEGPWDNSSYISDPGTLDDSGSGSAIGSIGNIDLSVSLLGISIPEGHMHDVEFHNGGADNPSYFAFDGYIYESDGEGGHTQTDCSVVGELENDDINAY